MWEGTIGQRWRSAIQPKKRHQTEWQGIGKLWARQRERRGADRDAYRLRTLIHPLQARVHPLANAAHLQSGPYVRIRAKWASEEMGARQAGPGEKVVRRGAGGTIRSYAGRVSRPVPSLNKHWDGRWYIRRAGGGYTVRRRLKPSSRGKRSSYWKF